MREGGEKKWGLRQKKKPDELGRVQTHVFACEGAVEVRFLHQRL